MTTTDRNHPGIDRPGPSGQNEAYLVLSPEERAKGFVRPVRRSYVHVGPPGPQFPLSDLSPEDIARFADEGWVKFEAYPEDHRCGGRYWSQAALDRAGKGCGTLTGMSEDIAETYARSPQFYGRTFCLGCKTHLPVEEFVWTGSNDRVGS